MIKYIIVFLYSTDKPLFSVIMAKMHSSGINIKKLMLCYHHLTSLVKCTLVVTLTALNNDVGYLYILKLVYAYNHH